MSSWTLLPLLAAIALTAGAYAAEEHAEVVARVNGSTVTEVDIALALGEIGPHLATVPAENRRRVLIDYVINSRLMSQESEKASLDETQAYKDRLKYYRHKVLKDLFLEHNVQGSITDAQAKKMYDEQVAAFEPQTEIRARHILVPTKEAASDIVERLARGDNFAELASAVSQDTATAEKGGDLGYFTKDQMVEAFAAAAFALEPGVVSTPVESKLGWHVIKVEDKRKQTAPSFDAMKDSILAALVQQKTGEALRDLRRRAEVEIVDPKAGSGESKPQDAPKP